MWSYRISIIKKNKQITMPLFLSFVDLQFKPLSTTLMINHIKLVKPFGGPSRSTFGLWVLSRPLHYGSYLWKTGKQTMPTRGVLVTPGVDPYRWATPANDPRWAAVAATAITMAAAAEYRWRWAWSATVRRRETRPRAWTVRRPGRRIPGRCHTRCRCVETTRPRSPATGTCPVHRRPAICAAARTARLGPSTGSWATRLRSSRRNRSPRPTGSPRTGRTWPPALTSAGSCCTRPTWCCTCEHRRNQLSWRGGRQNCVYRDQKNLFTKKTYLYRDFTGLNL